MEKNSLYDIEYFQKIKNAQKIRKKRAQRNRIILIVFVLLVVGYLISPLSRINDIVIIGNERYDENKIKSIAKVEEHQFSFLRPAFLIEGQLKDSNLFTEAKVTKSLFGNIKMNVKETRLLFYHLENKKIVFYDEKNNKLILNDIQTKLYQGMVPELTSKLNDEMKTKLVEKLAELDESVGNEISQIIYMPKQYDKENFRLVMSGNKEIYINASLDYIVKVGINYHSFAANTKYKCSYIEYIDTENKAIVKKCK